MPHKKSRRDGNRTCLASRRPLGRPNSDSSNTGLHVQESLLPVGDNRLPGDTRFFGYALIRPFTKIIANTERHFDDLALYCGQAGQKRFQAQGDRATLTFQRVSGAVFHIFVAVENGCDNFPIQKRLLTGLVW